MNKKQEQKYTTVQILKSIKKDLVIYCNKYGYKISGFLEKLIIRELNEKQEKEK
jgi:hypothetical protein